MHTPGRLLFCGLLIVRAAFAQAKSPLTLDDLFRYVDIRAARLSPDAGAAAIQTTRADWANNRFRDDLWLWRKSSDTLVALAQSGHDSDPQWSPDGKRIAFLSDRSLEEPGEEPQTKADKDKEIARVWIVDAAGGEPFPLYRETLKAHAFAWSRDSSAIFFSTQEPLSKEAEEQKKREWKDVSRWRADERGDLLLEMKVQNPQPESEAASAHNEEKEPAATLPKDARTITRSLYSINEIAPAPDGDAIAFLTNSISGRLEHPQQYEIYLASAQANSETQPKQLTHNEALEREIRWSADGKRLYFSVFAASGSLEGPYRDVQGRLYSLDPASGKVERLGSAFKGSWSDYAILPGGAAIGLGQLGAESQLYSLSNTPAQISRQPGTYASLDAARRADAMLFQHSSAGEPAELFYADDAQHPESARQITHFNTLFTERDLPQMKPYRWKAPDGKAIEGVLLYPPGKFEQKGLRMLTLIHGGPADADGNRFGADWYSWAILAAAKGWLVFQPNYRGSSGYGDDFMLAISPHIVSAPGADILAGVDALVKDGTADPAHLAIGGYSYGGYMTNWLITQTDRFRSAVTGAGAVEHAANWGNDDLTFDDAWYLGGTPWQKPATYQSEAALFRFDRVRTPVHEVMGGDDIRVSASEGYLLERALDALAIPHEFLIFPGEGHSLEKNPWHGYIKVREELKWIETYDQGPRENAPPATQDSERKISK